MIWVVKILGPVVSHGDLFWLMFCRPFVESLNWAPTLDGGLLASGFDYELRLHLRADGGLAFVLGEDAWASGVPR